jgi:HAE1 family hydrophobic/amphiphilic exporter-1
MPTLTDKLPKGIELNLIFNQADFIRKALSNLAITGILAVVMAVAILLLFLRSMRAAIIIGLAIPVSILVTFTAMYTVDLSLNIISLAGLALAIGMLVDNSIVVLENIYRHMELGKSPRRASIDGATEVVTAIFGSTLTTIAVFLPILFVPGLAGAMFKDMAMTICMSLTASLIVATTLIPLAASVFIRKGQNIENSLLAQAYSKIQSLTLSWKKAVFVVSWLLLFGSIGLITSSYLQGNAEFFPKQDSGLIIVSIKAQVGSTVEQIADLGRRAEQLIHDNVPEVELLATQAGSAAGFASLFSEGRHAGLIRVRLKPIEDRTRKQWQIEESIRKLLEDIPGLETKVFEGMTMGSTEGDVVINIQGHDIDTAKRTGLRIKRIVSEIEGAKDVTFSLEDARPEVHVRYDRERMSRLGLTSADVTSSVSSFFMGTVATIFRQGGQDYNVRVRAPAEFRKNPDNLNDLLIMSPLSGPILLRSFAQTKEQAGPVKITREDQRRIVKVIASTLPGKLAGLTSGIEEKLDSFDWPEDFGYRIGGAAEDMMESFFYLLIALGVSVMLVYMVMASMFESLLTPFVIGLTIPLGMTGVGVILFVTQTSLSVTAAIGVVVLVGVVVNNSIVLIDYANQLCAEGMSRIDAVTVAGKRRVRPILMTTLTTVLAMVPMALEIGTGAESWSPLARVIIGGLLIALFVTLLVVPIIYVWIGGGGAASPNRLSRNLSGDSRAPAPPAPPNAP